MHKLSSNHVQDYVRCLGDVVKSENIAQLSSIRKAHSWKPDFLSTAFSDPAVCQSILSKNVIPVLIVKAATRSLLLIGNESGMTHTMLYGATEAEATHLLVDLFNTTVLLFAQYTTSAAKDKLQGGHDALLRQLQQLVAGPVVEELLPAFAQYTQQVAHQALEQLAAKAGRSEQEQQQQKQQKRRTGHHSMKALVAEFNNATRHVNEMLCVWQVLLSLPVVANEQVIRPVVPAIALIAATDLAAVAVPLLGRVFDMLDCMDAKYPSSTASSSSKLSNQPQMPTFSAMRGAFCKQLQCVADTAVTVSDRVVEAIADIHKEIKFAENHGNLTSQQQPQALQEQLNQAISADSLPGLLLMSLACQAAGLHAVAQGGSQTKPMKAAVVESGASAEHTPSVVPRMAQQHVVLNTHKVMLTTLGLPAVVHAGLQRRCFCHDDCKHAIWGLCAAITMRSETAMGLASTKQCMMEPTLEAGLTPLAVKLLIEIAGLLAADEISIRAMCIEIIVILLLVPALVNSPAHVASSAADSDIRPQADTASASSVSSFISVSQQAVPAALRRWPVLPAAVAAGLLHPVVQLLSRAVIGALKETEPKQQLQRSDLHTEAISDGSYNAMLIHDFGALLISVGQSVEPKHIAAALRSDPVIPLVAIEAAIRAQHEQQQVPAIQLANLGRRSYNSGSSCGGPSDGPTALQLLPFVTRVVSALQEVTLPPQLTAQRENSEHKPSLNALPSVLVRVFSLVLTAEKVLATAAEHLKQQQASSAIATERDDDPATVLISFLRRQFGADTTIIQWYEKVTKSVVSLANNLSKHSSSNASHSDGSAGDTPDSGTNKDSSASIRSLPLVMLLRMLRALSGYLLAEQSRSMQLFTTLSADIKAKSLQEDTPPHSTAHSQIFDAVAELVTTGPPSLHILVLNLLQSISNGLAGTTIWQSTQDSLQQLAVSTDPNATLGLAVMQQQGLHGRLQELKVLGMNGEGLSTFCHNIKHMSLNALGKVCTCDDVAYLVYNTQVILEGLCKYWQEAHESASGVLAEIPVSFCCNDPTCVNLCMLSKYQLVSGRACVCGGCKVARYCSRECQQKHKRQHKLVCKHR